ncbi:MAG: hypothetical protein WCP11_00185 [Candidatus Saccharibacteria bacterium]
MNEYDKGYVALLTVVILGVVAAVIATSLVLLGLGHSRTALSEVQSASAKAAADSCAEEGLKQIRLSASYTGTGSLTLSNATCTYSVSASATSSVTATGISGNVTRRVTIDISSRTPSLVFTKWQEG